MYQECTTSKLFVITVIFTLVGSTKTRFVRNSLLLNTLDMSADLCFRRLADHLQPLLFCSLITSNSLLTRFKCLSIFLKLTVFTFFTAGANRFCFKTKYKLSGKSLLITAPELVFHRMSAELPLFTFKNGIFEKLRSLCALLLGLILLCEMFSGFALSKPVAVK